MCVSHDVCSVSLIQCCLSSYNSSNIESTRMSKPRQRQRNIRTKADHVTDCVFLPAHTTSNERRYTHFVHGLIGSEACRVGSRGGPHCESLPLRTLRSWKTLFEERGGAVAVLVGIADGSDRGNEDGRAPIFFLSHEIQRPLSRIGSPPRGSFPRRKGSTLRLSSEEEEVDGEDVDELLQSLMFAQAYCEWI